MTVAAILKHKGTAVAAVGPRDTVPEIVRTLAEWRIGAVLVRDAAAQLLGIVSERDIVRSLAQNGERTLGMTAAQLMTSPVYTIAANAAVAEAMARMTESRIRHLPVVENNALIGMISIGDVVKALLAEQASEVDSLKAYVAGSA
jgi:CBS domain-containing protein